MTWDKCTYTTFLVPQTYYLTMIGTYKLSYTLIVKQVRRLEVWSWATACNRAWSEGYTTRYINLEADNSDSERGPKQG